MFKDLLKKQNLKTEMIDYVLPSVYLLLVIARKINLHYSLYDICKQTTENRTHQADLIHCTGKYTAVP